MSRLKNSFLFQFAAFILLFVSSAACMAQAKILALSKTDHTLAIVDASTLKVLAKVPVGSDPHEVIASTDGKTAYVSIYGGGRFHEVDVIDISRKKLVRKIDTRPFYGPHGLDFQEGKLWFTVEGTKTIARYDPATNKIDWCMGSGQDRTHMIYVAEKGKNIYTTNVASGTVSIFSDTINNRPPPPLMQPPVSSKPGESRSMPPGGYPPKNWEQTIILTFKGTEGFDVSPDGNELWAASSDNGKIYVIDPAQKEIITTIDAKILGANRLKFTPDGSKVFISSLRSGAIAIYDAKTRSEIKQLEVGHGAAGILMDPEGSRAFVACTPDNFLVIVDLKTLQITGHLNVGGGPDGLAWAKGTGK
ncbi:MAG: YncE family protein [Ginsengibacter sp.]